MVTLIELIRLQQLYLPGSLHNPSYAFAGGSAIQCWLHDSKRDREHHDIDLFAFNTNFLKSCPRANLSLPLIIGGVERDGIVAYSPTSSTQIQIIQRVYYDSEIIPSIADVRQMTIDQTQLLVLSPEFLAVSKLSYPNIHRSSDFQDILALNQQGILYDTDYLSKLLSQTSVSKLVSVTDILRLQTQDDLQSFADSVHRQIIKRFLRWDRVHVEALAPLQFFALLDVENELFNLPSETVQFIDTILAKTSLSGRCLEIAKLGLHFLTVGIPTQSREILQKANFQAMIHRGLASIPAHSTRWLSRTKIIYRTLQYLAFIECSVQFQFEPIWSCDTMARIMQRILLDDPSHFLLFMLIKSVANDLKANREIILDIDKLLGLLETSTSECLIS